MSYEIIYKDSIGVYVSWKSIGEIEQNRILEFVRSKIKDSLHIRSSFNLPYSYILKPTLYYYTKPILMCLEIPILQIMSELKLNKKYVLMQTPYGWTIAFVHESA